MNKNIFMYSKNAPTIAKMLPDDINIIILDGENIIEDLTQSKIVAGVLILDADTILDLKVNFFKDIKSSTILQDLPILAYLSESSFKLKHKLYSLGIRGIISSELKQEVFSDYIYRILLDSNPNIGLPKDRFIKSLISYEHYDEIIQEVHYLTNYLIYNYHSQIDSFEAMYIRDSVSLLMISLSKNNINETMQLLNNMNISDGLYNILNSYYKPTNLKSNIILSSLLLHSNHFKVEIEKQVDFDTIDNEVYNFAKEAFKVKKTIITTYKDINNFWNIINQLLLENDQFDFDEIDKFLYEIFAIFNKALIYAGGLNTQVEIDTSGDYLQVTIEPFTHNKKGLKQFIHDLDENVYIEQNNNKKYLLVKLYAKDKKTNPQKVSKEINIDTPSKVSAVEYCKEVGIDHELLEDLDEISEATLNALNMQENLTSQAAEEFIKSLDKYSIIFNSSIDFKNVVDGFLSLRYSLENTSVDNLDYDFQVLINNFLSGVIDDLIKWKNHIYILQDAPDIHYLDDSMISNCTAIADMIKPTESDDQNDDEDEDDLEFF